MKNQKSSDGVNYREVADKLETKKKQLKDLENEINILDQLLKSICPHEFTRVVQRYFDGSYLNKAHTIYTRECETCRAVLETNQKQHNWYG